MNQQAYREDGYVIADEHGVYYAEKKDITSDWLMSKGYLPFSVNSTGMYNNLSVLLSVEKGQRNIDKDVFNLYENTVKISIENNLIWFIHYTSLLSKSINF